MARPVSFKDVSLTREPRQMGPGAHRRYDFFRRVMPRTMARRAATTFHISRESRYYKQRLVDALQDVDFYIKETMVKHRVDRDRAIDRVWRAYGRQYQIRGYSVEDWRDVYTRWLNEKVSPPGGEEE